MPLLNEEPSLWPETLLDRMAEAPSGRRWWVLYTKVQQEKAVARQLFGYRVPFYLPLMKKQHVYRGRTLVGHVPLFRGYVFLFGSDDERVLSLTTNRIARVLTVDEPDRLCRDLRQLRRLINSGAPLTVEARLVPGDHVRVRRGPLAGPEGTALRRPQETRLVVSVDFLRQDASVEIEDAFLEPL